MKYVKEIIRYYSSGAEKRGWLGKDIVTVILDTGVTEHPELKGQILKFKDFVAGQKNAYDDNGHGTHVAGIICGRQMGIAPESKIIVLKVLDKDGNGGTYSCLRAFRWILENQEKYNIRIVNLSMGMDIDADEQNKERILKAVDLLWDRGLVIIAAAGNLGPKEGSITIPGLSDRVITVGSYDIEYSGRGSIPLNMIKPDLVAPGMNIFSCNAKWKEPKEMTYITKSGTSMSTPVVSGAAAVLFSKYPYISNVQVKSRLKECCTDLHVDVMKQGSGLLNMERLLK